VYREYLNNNNINAPVFEVDAREENDVKNLVMALLFSIDPGLEA
jgi:signal recognition particle receptor subunit beta